MHVFIHIYIYWHIYIYTYECICIYSIFYGDLKPSISQPFPKISGLQGGRSSAPAAFASSESLDLTAAGHVLLQKIGGMARMVHGVHVDFERN